MKEEARRWFEAREGMGPNPSPENTGILLSRLGMPQQSFSAIHVAGSNGKGTCCAILANAFTLSGVCTGLFTSPHLVSVNERIRVDGEPISDVYLEACLNRIITAAQMEPVVEPTFFETTFLIAMCAFQAKGVRRAIIETGLGGRLDATRWVDADCCVLTEISLEHTGILGDSLEEIAAEKAAIVRQGRPLVAAWPYDAGARKAIEAAVDDHDWAIWWRGDRRRGIPFSKAKKDFRPLSSKPGFDGWLSYHQEAAMLARVTCHAMGLRKVEKMVDAAVLQTVWPGRMQWVEVEGQSLLLEAAHNPSGMARACEQIRLQKSRDIAPMPQVVILGCTDQVDLGVFLQPLVEMIVDGGITDVVVTEPPLGRKAPTPRRELADVLVDQGLDSRIHVSPDVASAWTDALACSRAIDADLPPAILCTGSLYLVGALLEHLGMANQAGAILCPAEATDPEP